MMAMRFGLANRSTVQGGRFPAPLDQQLNPGPGALGDRQASAAPGAGNNSAASGDAALPCGGLHADDRDRTGQGGHGAAQDLAAASSCPVDIQVSPQHCWRSVSQGE